jgi:hypothetical protein
MILGLSVNLQHHLAELRRNIELLELVQMGLSEKKRDTPNFKLTENVSPLLDCHFTI